MSIDEIRQNFVFAEPFVGHYYKEVALSDGTIRRIELTPMVHNGLQVVEFKDSNSSGSSFVNYIGLNGTDTHGTLMVQLRDVANLQAQAKAEGWPFPTSSGGAYPIRILPLLPVRVGFQRIPGAQSEAMTVTNEAEQPMNLFVAIFNAGKYVGTRDISLSAQASSTVDASQAWMNPRRSSNRPGQGPQPGDQVTLIDTPNQAGSHERKYQDWHGTVP